MSSNPRAYYSQGLARRVAVALVAATGTALLATSSYAGDYSHTCRSVDGQYVMQDEVLQTAEDERKGRTRSIRYQVQDKIILSKTEGYCQSRGQRFGYGSSLYVLNVSFSDQGLRTRVAMLCELASSGLPAAYDCNKDVRTLNWKIARQNPPPSPQSAGNQGDSTSSTGGSVWNHNGSTMRLTAQGAQRQIAYERPRSGMRKRGVRKGDVLFEGVRDGEIYSGTAYIFTRRCGKVGYDVLGTVRNNETQIVMRGNAPRFNASCKKVGSRPDKLVFSLN